MKQAALEAKKDGSKKINAAAVEKATKVGCTLICERKNVDWTQTSLRRFRS